MGFFIGLIGFFILAMLGKSLVGFPLVLPFILVISLFAAPSESLVLAFAAGIVMSLVNGTAIGRESLALLLASGIIHLYTRRFSRKHWGFALVFIVLGSIVYSLIMGNQITFLGLAVDIGLAGLAVPLVIWWKQRFYSEAIELKV